LSASVIDRYPHEFSGGQRQRIGIARALSMNPKFIICDEPTSALDVSVQAQIINLLRDLQRDLGLAYLFISHDMAVVSHMCARIAVMKAGKIVEIGSRDEIVHSPQHEYTQTLLRAVPRPVPRRTR
jgi:ABC-type oligopeptide transport system ATPase subunit